MILTNLPSWVWDVLADVVQYEEEHGSDWPCMDRTIARMPQSAHQIATAIARYRVTNGKEDSEQAT